MRIALFAGLALLVSACDSGGGPEAPEAAPWTEIDVPYLTSGVTATGDGTFFAVAEGVLYRSNTPEGGWKRVQGFGGIEVFFVRGGEGGSAVVTHRNVNTEPPYLTTQVTTDNGVTWTPASSRGWKPDGLGVSRAGRVLISDRDGWLWDGTEWSHVNRPSLPDGPRVEFAGEPLWASETDVLVAASYPSQNWLFGVQRSTDGGRTWADSGLPLSPEYPIRVEHRDDTGAVWMGNERGVYRSADGGSTWTEIPIPDGVPIALDARGPRPVVLMLASDTSRPQNAAIPYVLKHGEWSPFEAASPWTSFWEIGYGHDRPHVTGFLRGASGALYVALPPLSGGAGEYTVRLYRHDGQR